MQLLCFHTDSAKHAVQGEINGMIIHVGLLLWHSPVVGGSDSCSCKLLAAAAKLSSCYLPCSIVFLSSGRLLLSGPCVAPFWLVVLGMERAATSVAAVQVAQNSQEPAALWHIG